MNALVVLFIIFFFQAGDHIIYWDKNRKLTIEDFKKSPPNGDTNEKAITKYNIIGEVEKQENGDLIIRLEAVFYPLESWFIGNSPTLLAHEQLHFDIAEIAARKMRKAIICKCLKEKTNDINLVKDLTSEIFEETEIMQDIYDRETFHSVVEMEQKEWEQKVNAILDSLEDYSSMNEIIIAPDGKCIFPTHSFVCD